jgi:ATP-dependent helicase/DNAse subunit B
MPLTLITGPANAGKAGRVLDACLAALDQEPLLVVPRFEDIGIYQRELAARGAVFGARVVGFGRLWAEIARRTGLGARVLGPLEREHVVRAAVAASGLSTLAQSATAPGFGGAVEALVDELQAAGVEPVALGRALEAWAAGAGDRRAYARDVAALYETYRERLAATAALDDAGLARAALARLADLPEAWGGTPVLLYGFDDLTALELGAVEALAGEAGAEVTVSLTWEDEREAFASRSRTVERLRALDPVEERLPARSDHYAEGSRAALHALERSLFRPEPVPADERPDAGEAIRLLESGGDRNEIELIAAEVLALLRAGVPHGEIAVVFRSPETYASLVEPVFAAYGIPVAIERRRGLVHTALGRAVLGLLRCALGGGDASDLLAYLRAPGRVERPHVLDRLEARLRRSGALSATQAREAWERDHPPLEELDALTTAAAAGAGLLCEALARQADELFAAPHAKRGLPLAQERVADAAAHAAVTAALTELAAISHLPDLAAVTAADVLDALERLPVPLAAVPPTDAVVLAGPLAVRARRFRALILGGLQEDEFPRPPRPEPFLPDDLRRQLIDGGFELRDDAARLGDEGFLFYAVTSRPQERLVLSWRTSDEEGRPLVRSYFVDEVRRLFSGLDAAYRRRALGDVTWPPADAPTAAELERSLRARGALEPPPAIAPVTWPAALAALAEPRVMSAGALESFAQCPVKWLVDKRLRAQTLAPDAEPLRRGGFAHALLERTLRGLRAERGSAQLTPASLPAAERLLEKAAVELQATHNLGDSPAKARSVARRLIAHVRRLLRWEAARPGRFVPVRLESWFGPERAERDDDEEEDVEDEDPRLPALELGDGELTVHGRVDRVDRADTGRAVVRDYKLGEPATEHQQKHWDARGQLQVALYMLAVHRGLGWELAGGVYQGLRASGPRLRPRGLLLDAPEVLELVPGAFAHEDVRTGPEFEAALGAAAARALELARAMRSGALAPSPDTCGFAGRGCAYPGICRSVRA